MMTMNPTTKARFLLVGKLLLMLVFAISFTQWPLYSSGQNGYFLHGLANAGVGFLNMDWLSQTADTAPVFSVLVNVTIQFLDENTFYFFYITIIAIYCYSLLGIACYVYGIGNSSIKYLSYFVLFTMLYSGLLARLLRELPVLYQFTSDLHKILTHGVAGQVILGFAFLPCAFGVFLILSIYSFLRDKPFVAVACLSITATFHASSILSAAVLTCTYITVIVVKEKNYRKALLLGTVALVLVIPTLTYIYLNFRPTDADTFAQAQSILVDYRMPHHAKVTSWFGQSTLFQITIIALSIYLVRRTKLLPILLVPFLVATILTVAQALTGNKGLALLYPWRISVFLVPIASSIILACIVSVAFQIFSKPISRTVRSLLQAAILAVIIMLGYFGVHHTIWLLNAPNVGLNASTRFVASTFQPGNLYLIPPDMLSFRLAAGVPILVDFKAPPKQDAEVVEWFNRVEIAKDFYASSGDTACSILKNISDKYGTTHVLLRSDSSIAICGILRELYRDADFAIYEIQNR
ncbi:MAG: DUF6798 domain-containing protein [Thiotrichaceae bacterium]